MKKKQQLFILLIISTISLAILSCKKETENTDAIPLTITDAVKVKTLEEYEFIQNGVIINGKIRDDGGKKILKKGICWSTKPKPLVKVDNFTEESNGSSHEFSSTARGLTQNTTYYMRTYATTNEGTAYGNEITVSFPIPPFVKTHEVNTSSYYLEYTSAKCEGEVYSLDESPIFAYGVCYDTLSEPTLQNNISFLETTPKDYENNYIGYISLTLKGLTSGTTYYARVYAINPADTVYANVVEFTTPYKVGDIGPAGGYIIYDKGGNSSGWRYLEASPEDIGVIDWGCVDINPSTASSIGYGKSNTDNIMSSCNDDMSAARMCYDYISSSGHGDWFLPSLGELELMYNELHAKNLSNFTSNNYSSSSDVDTDFMKALQFLGGIEYNESKSEPLYVRPIRRF